jgi:hypothetical protein
MIAKRVLKPDRIRKVGKGFSFIPHRFLTGGILAALQPTEILLYIFSFWRQTDTACRFTATMPSVIF